MSILSICTIAFVTLCALAALLSPINLTNALGMICHDSPYLSFSHPQRSLFPRPTTSSTARRTPPAFRSSRTAPVKAARVFPCGTSPTYLCQVQWARRNVRKSSYSNVTLSKERDRVFYLDMCLFVPATENLTR